MAGNYIDDLAEDIHEAAHGHVGIDPLDWPLYRIYAVLGRSVGSLVTKEMVHDAWAAWVVGRDDYDPTRAPVPYRDLTPEVRARDRVFRDAIRSVSARRFAKGDR
jgi:hypothetical protein